MGVNVELLQELPEEERFYLGDAGVLGCCALGSLGTCLGCTITCTDSCFYKTF